MSQDPPFTDELVVEPNGKPRQAGARPALDNPDEWVARMRTRAERSLFFFTKGVLGKHFLSPALHGWLCGWLQQVPPRRKLCLMPREFGKSAIVSDSLPLHILIQPKDGNIYFPGEDGSDTRILLVCETEKRSADHLRVLQSAMESNKLLRALWPHRVWRDAKSAKKWNGQEMIIPRRTEWPDPSVRGIGVGQAITGAHPNVLVKDDLVTEDAANSPLVMENAIAWHKTSRALMANQNTALEFIIGTRWAVRDLYEIVQEDHSVESAVRRAIEEGQSIWPEKYSLDDLHRIQAEQGVMWPLLYMNSAADPELTDFQPHQLRYFRVDGDQIVFDEDARDISLRERENAPRRPGLQLVGKTLDRDTYDVLKARNQFFRLRAT